MVLNLYIFSAGTPSRRCGYGIAGGYFTDVMLHSSRNYHHERATELRQLSKDVAVDCGAVMLRFHGSMPWSFLSIQVVNCGIGELEQGR